MQQQTSTAHPDNNRMIETNDKMRVNTKQCSPSSLFMPTRLQNKSRKPHNQQRLATLAAPTFIIMPSTDIFENRCNRSTRVIASFEDTFTNLANESVKVFILSSAAFVAVLCALPTPCFTACVERRSTSSKLF